MIFIVKRELRAHIKSLLIWSGSVIAVIFMMMSEFSAYYDNPEMADILDSMPESMLEAFGIASANLTTLSGFFSIASIYFAIMLGIHAALLGSSIISKEERDKTVEFLLTLPVSRKEVITGKAIAAVILSIILLGVTGVASIASSMPYEPDQSFLEFLGLLMIAIFIIQMIFLSIGMLLASIIKRYKKSGAISISLLLGTYILSVLVSLSDKIEFLKYATPFKYFEASYLVNERHLEGIYIVISLGIIVVSIVGTYVFYPKRDLHI